MLDRYELGSIRNNAEYDALCMQVIRMIRNELKDFMTNHRAHITPDQQDTWYTSFVNSGTDRLCLYLDTYSAPIGYTLVTLKNDKYYGTLAVLPEFHGNGYGTEMYTDMVAYANLYRQPLHIEIFADNKPSLVAALKAGFQLETITDKLVTLVSN